MAEKDEENPSEVHRVPVAKRHSLLQEISQQLDGIELDKSVEIAGFKFYITTLTADEEQWADSFVTMVSEASFVSSQRVPRLAASIKRINGENVDTLFEFPEDASKEDIAYHSASQYRKRYWVMNQVLLWLGDRNRQFIDDLWKEYTALLEKRKKSWDELKNSYAGTPGGNSKATSSPEKGSSQATLA